MVFVFDRYQYVAGGVFHGAVEFPWLDILYTFTYTRI